MLASVESDAFDMGAGLPSLHYQHQERLVIRLHRELDITQNSAQCRMYRVCMADRLLNFSNLTADSGLSSRTMS